MIGCISSLGLSYTNKLDLYIHPRYIIFTTVFSIIGILIILASSFLGIDDHASDDKSQISSYRYIYILILIIVATVGLIVAKPATLTSSTFKQRGISAEVDSNIRTSAAVPLFGNNDYSNLSLKDWSTLLNQTSDIDFFKSKTASLSGFISPDEDDPQNVFYLSRFVITCCAVDARPIGIPVFLSNWTQTYKPDQWLQITGTFVANPSPSSQQGIALNPEKIIEIPQPEKPYAY